MPGRVRKAPELFVAEPARQGKAAKTAKSAPKAAVPAKGNAVAGKATAGKAAAAPSPKKKASATGAAAAKSGAASADARGVVDGAVASVDASLAARAEVHEGADGAPLHAALAFVEPAKNSDKFYVLQCLAAGGFYHVFTRWGRTGQAGQCALDGPSDEATALRAFAKAFQSKTGQAWVDRTGFAQLPGKYDLLNFADTLGPSGRWQYWVDDGVDGKKTGWYDYDGDGTAQTEELHSTWEANAQYGTRFVESGSFTYKVDLEQMTQENTRTGKQRHIRRVAPGSKPDDAPPCK